MMQFGFQSFNNFHFIKDNGKVVREVGKNGIQQQYYRGLNYLSQNRIQISNMKFNGCRDMPDGCSITKINNHPPIYGLLEGKRVATVGNRAFGNSTCQLFTYYYDLLCYGEKNENIKKPISFFMAFSEEYCYWFYLDECQGGINKILEAIHNVRSNRKITACKMYEDSGVQFAVQNLMAMYPYHGEKITNKFDLGRIMTEITDHCLTIQN